MFFLIVVLKRAFHRFRFLFSLLYFLLCPNSNRFLLIETFFKKKKLGHHFVPRAAWTYIAGVIAVVSVLSLGVASVLGVCLVLMLKTKERVCLPYRPAVAARLVLSALAGKEKINLL